MTAPVDRVRLAALRYAGGGEESATYVAIMRTFTGGDRRAPVGPVRVGGGGAAGRAGRELDADTVDDRLSYLVEHGNLAGRLDGAAIAAADPDGLARDIGTVFAQFERLVSSTRDFYMTEQTRAFKRVLES